MYQVGMVPRGEVFSLYYPKMLKQMAALFNVFYAANDFDIFYKTALWAKININEAQFIFALYNAVIRRPDTQYIQLPPVYELYPYAFFNSEVLEKAHHAKIFGKLGNYLIYLLNYFFACFLPLLFLSILLRLYPYLFIHNKLAYFYLGAQSTVENAKD